MKKDIEIAFTGFKYPERTYGQRYTKGQQNNSPIKISGFAKEKLVTKPLERVNLQSLSYYRPTIVTREYQRDLPRNIIPENTRFIRANSMMGGNDKKASTYYSNFYKPSRELLAETKQDQGI